jgi:glycosyltransferase involved in cell wall biosynthesis
MVPFLAGLGFDFSFWVPRPSGLYDDLQARGWDVDGAPRSIEYSVRAWRLEPGPVRRLVTTPSYFRHFASFLESRRPALVHANSVLTLAEALAARRRGVPTLLHVHEMLPANLRSRLLRKVAWEQLDQIVAVSRPCAAQLAWNGRVPTIVYESAPVPEHATTLREDPRPFTVGTVAVVSTRKGSDLFVEAARLLGERVNGANGHGQPGFRFEMVGAPSDAIERDWAQSVLKRAQEVGIDHAASADVWQRLRRWDAFALPSRADPFPLSMLEAMASGLPVIGARTDGIAEQLVPGTGVLVEPGNPRALADAIAWLAAQRPTVREQLGSAARRRVTDNFSLAHQVQAMEAVYRRLLAGTGEPGARAGTP